MVPKNPGKPENRGKRRCLQKNLRENVFLLFFFENLRGKINTINVNENYEKQKFILFVFAMQAISECQITMFPSIALSVKLNRHCSE